VLGRRGVLVVLVVGALAASGCERWRSDQNSPRPSPDVFTPAHATVGAAVGEFFSRRATPVQPLAFPHKTHLAKGVACTDCHESVATGPIAGIPGVKTCMICHESIATDRPLIQQVTAYAKRKVDIPWQRVYGYAPSAHVRFTHAPHIQAKVDCATCHGNLAEQTVAERKVDLTMGFCVTCHRSRQASLDCLACHF
jgi:hypothetical protein